MNCEAIFYMIFVENGNPPSYKHNDIFSAKTEAERLARKTGKRVYVLKNIADVVVTDAQWSTNVIDDEIPF